MTISISKKSRLNFSNLLVVDGIQFWDAPDYPSIPINPDDVQYTTSGSDRIDTLAYKFYGDPSLWWVIALANDMELLPTDLSESMTLRIPSPSWVKSSLFSGQ